jgi:hypothetical protein
MRWRSPPDKLPSLRLFLPTRPTRASAASARGRFALLSPMNAGRRF